jgi:hypothetical protein
MHGRVLHVQMFVFSWQWAAAPSGITQKPP